MDSSWKLPVHTEQSTYLFSFSPRFFFSILHHSTLIKCWPWMAAKQRHVWFTILVEINLLLPLLDFCIFLSFSTILLGRFSLYLDPFITPGILLLSSRAPPSNHHSAESALANHSGKPRLLGLLSLLFLASSEFVKFQKRKQNPSYIFSVDILPLCLTSNKPWLAQGTWS